MHQLLENNQIYLIDTESKYLDDCKNLEIQLRELAQKFQNEVGLKNLVNFVESSNFCDNHIIEYRKFIRAHIDEWRYPDIGSNFSCLYRRFRNTSINYVEIAIRLFELLREQNEGAILEALHLAFISESERGREGKTSNIGLDNQQELLIMALEQEIGKVSKSDRETETQVNFFCQTLANSSAAELKKTFYKYIEVCNEDLSMSNLVQINQATDGLASKLLREFSCFSITKFNRQLNLYRRKIENTRISQLNVEEQTDKKVSLTKQISTQLLRSGHSPAKFLELVEQIEVLNFLNDVLDVKYALKSWPGFIHWEVLSNVPRGIKISEYSKTLN